MIALARRHNIEVTERRIMPEELTGFSECFITGTAAEITAVSEIADWTFHTGRDYAPIDGGLHRRGPAERQGRGGVADCSLLPERRKLRPDDPPGVTFPDCCGYRRSPLSEKRDKVWQQ